MYMLDIITINLWMRLYITFWPHFRHTYLFSLAGMSEGEKIYLFLHHTFSPLILALFQFLHDILKHFLGCSQTFLGCYLYDLSLKFFKDALSRNHGTVPHRSCWVIKLTKNLLLIPFVNVINDTCITSASVGLILSPHLHPWRKYVVVCIEKNH